MIIPLRCTLALVFVFINSLLFAQNLFSIGLSTQSAQCHNNFEQTNDGGFIIASERSFTVDTSSYQVERGFLTKVDSTGTVEWSKCFPKSDWQLKSGDGNSVCETYDGGYMMVSDYTDHDTVTFSDMIRLQVIKTDSNGNLLWTKLYTGLGTIYVYCIKETQSHGYIICGITRDSITMSVVGGYLLRIDSIGNLVWSRVYSPPPGNNTGYFNSVEETRSGDFLICGGAGNSYGWMVRTDPSGNVIWSKRSLDTWALEDVTETSTGDVICVGHNQWQAIAAVYKVDSVGNPIWSMAYRSGTEGMAYAVSSTADGCTFAGHGVFTANANLTHVDHNGNVIWTRTYTDMNQFSHMTMQRTSDGGYAITGGNYSSTSSGMIMIRTDSLGFAYCHQTTPADTSWSLSSMSDLAIGTMSLNGTSPWLQVMTPALVNDSSFCTIPDGITENSSLGIIQVYPNPTCESVTIQTTEGQGGRMTFRICDGSGRTVIANELPSCRTIVDVSSLSTGLYFVLVEQNNAIIGQIPLIRY